MKLFEYAIIADEKRNEKDEVVRKASVLVGPATLLAKDEKQATMLVAREIPADVTDDLDSIIVAIRPF